MLQSRRRPKRMRITWGDRLFFFMFLIPGIALYLVFYYYPNISSLIFALFDWNLGKLEKSAFVGLKFFERLLDEKDIILKCMGNNLFMSGFSILIGLLLAFFISGMVSSGKLKHAKDTQIYRSVMYFPNIIPPVATAMLWSFIYSPVFGTMTPLLEALGLHNISATGMLGNVLSVKPAIILMGVWGAVGFYFIILFSAMCNVPTDYGEAAAIDGAGEIRKFFVITLPLIANSIRTLFLLGMAGMFSGGFINILVLTNGGPNRASETLTSYMYQQAFGMGMFGYGAAIGTLVFVLSVALYLICSKLFSKGGVYEY